MKKSITLKVILVCVAFAIGIAAGIILYVLVGKVEEKKEDVKDKTEIVVTNDSDEIVDKKDKTKENKEEKTSSDEIRMVSEKLNFALNFPKDLKGCIMLEEGTDDSIDKSIGDNLIKKEEYATFTGNKNGCEFLLCTVFRIEGKYEYEQMDEYKPECLYLGIYDGYTYSYILPSVIEDEQGKNYGDYLECYAGNMGEYFEYIK